MPLRLFALLVLALACRSEVAAEELSPYLGVWKGTLGSHAVRVCLHESSSSYYCERLRDDDRWLTLRDDLSDVFCGGAHSFSESLFHVFDLTTGEQVKVDTWFHTGADAPSYRRFDPRLEALVWKAAAATMPEDCGKDAYLNPYPSARGMSFWLSHGHAMRACDDTVTLPYAKVMPYLSASGREAVRSLMAKPR